MTRVFTGVKLPQEFNIKLHRICNGIPTMKWVEPQNFHCTLNFFENLSESQTQLLLETLKKVSFPQFETSLKYLGTFPPRGLVKTLWVGFCKPNPLIDLKSSIDSKLHNTGIKQDSRNYLPHVTLGRLKTKQKAQLQQYLMEYGQIESPLFKVKTFYLIQSRLSSKGSNYETIEEYPLYDNEHEE